MVLQNSGTVLRFSQIQTEMGGTNPISLSEYYGNATSSFTRGIVNFPRTGENLSVGTFYSKAKPQNGLFFKISFGYFNENVNYFTSPATTGRSNSFTSINTSTNGNLTANGFTTTSVEWTGSFYAVSSGTYTFYTNSDDASFMWVGSNAESGYTTANSLVNNSGLHAMQERSGTIVLEAGRSYPIRIQYGQNAGGADFAASFAGPGIAKTSIGTGYFYS
jgi:hypothetical protein